MARLARGLFVYLLPAALMLAAGVAVALAGNTLREIESRRALERKNFTDAEIVDGFLKTTFGAEFRVDGRVDRIRKYEGPARIYIDSRATPNRSAQVVQIVNDIRARIRHLDIAVTTDRSEANIIVVLVRDRDLAQTIKSLYGPAYARRIEKSLEPQCLSSFRKDEAYRITRSDVILVVDAGDFVFYDCAYEELLQSLGPINDDNSVPWTMFNDNVQMGFFDLYDQYLLNILYDPRIRPGMTHQEAQAALPSILPSVREFVAGVNQAAP